ncbi:hypothetical protein ACFSO0_04145 [Brevibacillus sp. GCM10020057]|uniref:hypothetical protein n=1 Tax=Brevibacillus sp. GCM10020057 TaxID=3317327 RepID=UPI0036373885
MKTVRYAFFVWAGERRMGVGLLFLTNGFRKQQPEIAFDKILSEDEELRGGENIA